MKYYEQAINKTKYWDSTGAWVPTDDKDMCRYILLKLYGNEMQIYWYKEPELDDKIKNEF
jgi:hypothetical protein